MAGALTLGRVISGNDGDRDARLARIVEAVDQLTERIEEMADDPDGNSTTVVPCPKTGLATTVCTPQKDGETDAAYAARHLAKVQAFVDACADD